MAIQTAVGEQRLFNIPRRVLGLPGRGHVRVVVQSWFGGNPSLVFLSTDGDGKSWGLYPPRADYALRAERIGRAYLTGKTDQSVGR